MNDFTLPYCLKQMSYTALPVVFCTTMLQGCTGERDITPKPQPLDNVQVNTVNQPSVRAPSGLSPHAAQLADAVQQSQARLASSRSDVCPKLIEFKVGDTTTYRAGEKMRNQRCKYFIYPKKGDKLSVKISNDKMKAEMVQPKYFNFENGVYAVVKSGKHVLDISYKDYHGSRPAESYDLTVSTL